MSAVDRRSPSFAIPSRTDVAHPTFHSGVGRSSVGPARSCNKIAHDASAWEHWQRRWPRPQVGGASRADDATDGVLVAGGRVEPGGALREPVELVAQGDELGDPAIDLFGTGGEEVVDVGAWRVTTVA